MALPDVARNIIQQELESRSNTSSTKNIVYYDVESNLLNDTRNGTTAKVSFKFSKPVSADLLNVKASSILKMVSSSLSLEGDIGALDKLLKDTAGVKGTIGRKKTKGRVEVNFGDPEDSEGTAGTIRGASGRFVSNNNMRILLELVAKEYLIKDMKKMGAPLKYRTGRFANSLKVKDAHLLDSDSKDPELSITYNYMTRPYSVFNPAVSTYRRLSLRPFAGARNPQKLIGEALAKAARDLIHSRYKIKVNQGI